MKFLEVRAVGAMLATLMLIASSALASDPVPIDLGDLGGDPSHPLESHARDINIHGQVIGSSEVPPYGHFHGFLWTQNGGMVDLGAPGGYDSTPLAINDAGTIVGYDAPVSGHLHPWVWRNGQFTWLPMPRYAYASGVARVINQAGVITGCVWYNSFPEVYAVTWDPDPPYSVHIIHEGGDVCPVAIDDAAHIAGETWLWTSGWFRSINCADCKVRALEPGGSGRMVGKEFGEPVLWSNLDYAPKIPVQPTFCSDTVGGAEAVNDSTQIAGWITSCNSSNGLLENVGFVWNPDSGSILLRPLGQIVPSTWNFVSPDDINEFGDVVGSSPVGDGKIRHATLWRAERSVSVVPSLPCVLHPCHVPPEIWYIPNRFINNGILSKLDFDATKLDPRLITLGDGQGHVAKVETDAAGTPQIRIEDLDRDGHDDLVVTFNTTQLINEGALTPETSWLEISAERLDGSPFKSRYPVWVRTHE